MKESLFRQKCLCQTTRKHTTKIPRESNNIYIGLRIKSYSLTQSYTHGSKSQSYRNDPKQSPQQHKKCRPILCYFCPLVLSLSVKEKYVYFYYQYIIILYCSSLQMHSINVSTLSTINLFFHIPHLGATCQYTNRCLELEWSSKSLNCRTRSKRTVN